jgi:hypothetical protein
MNEVNHAQLIGHGFSVFEVWEDGIRSSYQF